MNVVTTSARDGNKAPPAVFLQDFVDVERPADQVGAQLATGSAWLAPLAGAAGDDAALLVRVGPQLLGDILARTVVVRLGLPSRRNGAVLVPIRWEDAQHPALFPVLDGDLEVASLDDNRCRIVLSACYRPPLRAVGRIIDEAVLHRVAESTVRAFLRRAASALVDGISPA